MRNAMEAFSPRDIRYLDELHGPLAGVFARMDAEAAAEEIPLVSTSVGHALRVLVRATGARRIVEVGTATGYSALWMAYGAMLMIVGFLRRSAFVRWQALILIAVTIVKVFVYDVSQLDRAYRIVSFIVLGILLLAISFVYQRDWLQLSAKGKTQPASEGGVTPV